MAENTLDEWSDGEDDWVWDVDLNNTLDEWSDGEDDWIWDVDSNLSNEPSDIIQTGRGKKRKSDDQLLPEKEFYEMESVKKHHSKKFGMTATDHIIRFNTVLAQLDLLESYVRTQAIFEHLLKDVTQGMNEKDHVRFVLRSDQPDTPVVCTDYMTPEVTSQITSSPEVTS